MNKLMLVYLLVNFLFLGCGGLLLAFALISEQHEKTGLTVDNVAVNLLLTECPLTGINIQLLSQNEANSSIAGVVNAIFMFITFLASLPALALPMNRGFLKIQGWMVVMCSFFSLILGLFIWFDTLQTQKNLMGVWTQQSVEVQSLMQQRVSIFPNIDLCPALLIFPVRLLRLLKLHVTTIRRRFNVSRFKDSRIYDGLCRAIRITRKCLPRSYLHCCLWHRWSGCPATPLHRHGSQIPFRTREISAHR
jgi:hypothetical protein